MIRRGEVYWVNLDPTVGSEINKTRPGLVVSNDINNVHSRTVTILPLTTSVDKVYPFEVPVPAGIIPKSPAAKVKANQIRTVDKRRVGDLLGPLPSGIMDRVDLAMKLHLSL